MLDTKKVGYKIASLRKKTGLSQERLSDLLRISPQAISKWENGHTLPDTSLLPMLAQVFGCTIDDIIMPAYAFEENLEETRPNQLEEQAELIAERVMKKLGGTLMHSELNGLGDAAVINAIYKAHGSIGGCTVSREKPYREFGNLITNITARSPQRDFKLIQKVYLKDDAEMRAYELLSKFTRRIPQVFHIDPAKQIILLEDLSDGHIRGNDFNEDNDSGKIIRDNYHAILKSAAGLHAACWEHREAFDLLGTDFRLQSAENLLVHINGMENSYRKYRKKEEAGKLPKVWESFENNLDFKCLDYYDEALKFLRKEYAGLIHSRFMSGRNITVIHGNMHPGTSFMSKSDDRDVKFDGLQAVRIGLPTEDLAMLLALHIEPDKGNAMRLLDDYYHCLSYSVQNYPYETFLSDYKISVAENLFFPLRLFSSGIFDYSMRDKALLAFETFVLSDTN